MDVGYSRDEEFGRFKNAWHKKSPGSIFSRKGNQMNCAQKTKCSLTEVVRNSECIVKNPKFILVRLAGLVYRGACRRMAARHRCGDHGEDDDRALEADAEAVGQLRDLELDSR